MTQPIQTAVLGFGLAGRVFHCPFVAAVPGLQLVAIVQRRSDEAAAAYPDARVLRSVDEAFAAPEIELIVVGTPNDTHFEMARRALEAGKHVVIDKPFTGTSEEARQLIALAQKMGKKLFPFHNRRYDGDFLTVRKLVEENRLGRVVQITSRFDRFRPQPRPNTWKEEGGRHTGLLWDLGPHLIDQAMALFGVPDAITASVRHDRDQTDIVDAFDVVLEFKAHRVRYGCHSTMLAAEPPPRFLVWGTEGSYSKHGVDPQEPKIVAGARPPHLDSAEAWLPEAETAWGTLTSAVSVVDPIQLERQTYPTVPGDYRQFYVNVRDTILGTASQAITADDGYSSIRIMELALQSSVEGRTLSIDF